MTHNVGKDMIDFFKAMYHQAARMRMVPSRIATPFIIVGSPRSGSTLLQTLLNSHPNIVCMHELFRPNGSSSVFRRHYFGSRRKLLELRDRAPEQFLQHVLYSRQPLWVRAVGFKALWIHPAAETRERVWCALGELPDLNVLWINRNAVRCAVSLYAAWNTGAWAGKENNGKFAIDPARVVKWLTHNQECRELACRSLRNSGTLEVQYEHLATDPDGQIRRILKFLDVPYRPVLSPLKKQITKPLHEIVVNYEELEAALRDTQWYDAFQRADDDLGSSGSQKAQELGA